MKLNPSHDPAATLDEGLLVQYLHGELDAQSANQLSGHIAQCAACRTLVHSLDLRSRRASEALHVSGFDEPDTNEWRAVLNAISHTARARRRATHLRIAAGWIIATAAVAGLSSSPVRAWIAERWAGVIGRNTTGQTPAPAESTGTVALSFEPTSPVLDVVFDATQANGTVRIRFTEDPAVNVAVTGGGEEELAWSQSGVHIANVPGSAASYEISLARTVERVAIRIGGNEIVDLRRGEASGAPVELGLDDGRVRNPPARDEDDRISQRTRRRSDTQ